MKTPYKLKVFVCYKDKTLANEGKTYFYCHWVQFMSNDKNQYLKLWDSGNVHKGYSDVLIKKIKLADINYFDIFEENE